jgi:DNA-binding transcriptional MerR regulator
VREGAGSGSQRRFSDEDLARIKLIAALLKAGVSLQAIRRHGPKVALDRTMVDLRAVSDELERQMEAVAS